MVVLCILSVLLNVTLLVLVGIPLYKKYIPFILKTKQEPHLKRHVSPPILIDDNVAWINFSRSRAHEQMSDSFSIVTASDTRCDPVSVHACFTPEMHTRLRAMMRVSKVKCIADVISDALYAHEMILGLDAQDYSFGYHDQQKWVVLPLSVEYTS